MLERPADQHVDQHDYAYSQNEQGQLLDFQVVLARVRFGCHSVFQFAIKTPSCEWLDRGWHVGNVPKVWLASSHAARSIFPDGLGPNLGMSEIGTNRGSERESQRVSLTKACSSV